MNAAMLRAFAISLFATACGTAIATSNPTESPSEFTVTLRYGTESALSHEAVQALYLKAMEVLESSNFNSRAPRWEWNVSVLLDEFRQAVSGNYLLITFSDPQQVKTVGGEISVKEILVGLNGQQYASSLHTIDDEERVVGHAKYSGHLCIELLNLVEKLVTTPNNACMDSSCK